MRKVIILGSTGSIGKSTLQVIRGYRKKFKVVGLSSFKNIELLRSQAREFRPSYVNILDKRKAKDFNLRGVKVLAGEEGLGELSQKECDFLILGIPGLSALLPLWLSLGKAKKVILANKEAIISAGKLITRKLKATSTELFPVDSEAWAVSNLLKSQSKKEVFRLYITASGGPFWDKPKKEIKKAKPKEALKHPVWKMGKKISVDSATLMNKGFEILEIKRLFNFSLENIGVLIHPQSLVHALAERKDHTILAFMFFPDMKIPISAGLGVSNFPGYRALALEDLGRLNFIKPDYEKFPSLRLAYFVGKKEKSFPLVLVSSDEEAVNLYLKGRISFLGIVKIVEEVIESHSPREINSLGEAFSWEAWAKEKVRELVSKKRF